MTPRQRVVLYAAMDAEELRRTGYAVDITDILNGLANRSDEADRYLRDLDENGTSRQWSSLVSSVERKADELASL